MESAHERQIARIKPRLLSQPKSFGFYQAMRLLGWLAQESGKTLRVLPKLNQSFPASDIEAVVETDTEYQLITNFLSLYTTDSPMPMYTIERWMQQDQGDDTAELDFLNIFHQRIYEMLFGTWQKYRLAHRMGQNDQPQLNVILNGISGLGFRASARVFALYPELAQYARFFMPANSSPYNLQTLISLCFNIPATVESFYPAPTVIHVDQQNCLGRAQHQLGVTLYLGQLFASVNSNLLIRLSINVFSAALDFMPKGKKSEKLQHMLFLYLAKPLRCFLQLELSEKALQACRLGDATPLGQVACLGTPTSNSHNVVTYLL